MSQDQQRLLHLIALCHSLEQQNKTPTVSLLRAKAQFSVPLPLAVAAVRQYKQHSPAKEKVDEARAEPVKALTLEKRVEALEKQVGALQQLLSQKI